MCRIFGISYGERPEKLSTGQIARIMGVNLVHGGPHAFGWMQNVDGDVTYRKHAGRLDDQLDKLNSIRRECSWFVGHVRYATHGENTWGNIHPIRHDDILGVHNGVLSNHERVLNECGGREFDHVEVDSEAIFAAVQHFGHVPGLAKIRGSMVAVYTDLRKPKSLYVARSDSRALRIGWTKRGNLIFASEQRALDVLEENGIEFVGFSGISENRVLRIADGEIRDRTTFRDPFPARRAYLDKLSNESLIDMAQKILDHPEASMAQADGYGPSVAARRGEKLFPSGRRRIPEERLQAWRRDHHNEFSRPETEKKPKKRRAVEVGVPVGENIIAYKGKRISLEEYLKMRSQEISEAMHPEDDWEE